MEIRESLTRYGFDGDNTPVVIGSALCALEVRLSQEFNLIEDCDFFKALDCLSLITSQTNVHLLVSF